VVRKPRKKGEMMLQRGGPRQDQAESLSLDSEGEWPEKVWGEMQSSVEELKSLVELLGDETAGWSRRVILEEAVSRLADLELQLGVRPTGARQAS